MPDLTSNYPKTFTPSAETARTTLASKRKEQESMSKAQLMTKDIQKLKNDTLKIFTELARIPSLDGNSDQLDRMISMTLEVQRMTLAEMQAEETGALVESNSTTQLLIAAGYSGREAEVANNTINVFPGEEPKLSYEVPFNGVDHVRILVMDQKGNVAGQYLGDGHMGKHGVNFEGIHLNPGQYTIKAVPIDASGKPLYEDKTRLELKRVPVYTVAPIHGWELNKGTMHFSDGRTLRPATTIKQILSPNIGPSPKERRLLEAELSTELEADRATQRALAELVA